MPRYQIDLKPRRSQRESIPIALKEPVAGIATVDPVAVTGEDAGVAEAPLDAILNATEVEQPKQKRILIAGASGAIGYPLLNLAKDSGYWVRSLSKSRWRAPKVSLLADELWLRDATDREAIRGICQGADVVVSCLGGSLDPRVQEKRGYSLLDFNANRYLLDEAIEAKVRRFVYVSVYGTKQSENTAFVRAHRRFENALRESGLEFTILRFAGLHATPDSLIATARDGAMPLFGHNSSRTNPIHPKDAAQICLENLDSGPEIVEAGGPDIFTRRELSEMVFGYAGTRPSFCRIPAILKRLTSGLAHPFNPRKANLREFALRSSRADVIAPRVGKRSFVDYLLEHRDAISFVQETV